MKKAPPNHESGKIEPLIYMIHCSLKDRKILLYDAVLFIYICLILINFVSHFQYSAYFSTKANSSSSSDFPNLFRHAFFPHNSTPSFQGETPTLSFPKTFLSTLNVTTFPKGHGCREETGNQDFQKFAFIIGPQKTGTTFLSSVLQRIPSVVMSWVKETAFFNRKDLNTSTDYINFIWPEHEFKENEVLFEASASTLVRLAFKEIDRFAQSPKYVMLLRDPTERYLSELNHYHRFYYGPDENKPEKTLDDILGIKSPEDLHEKTEKFIATRDAFVTKGSYVNFLEKWDICCESMIIVDQRDMSAKVILRMLQHIGVADNQTEAFIQDLINQETVRYNTRIDSKWYTLPKPLPKTVRMVNEYYKADNKRLWELLEIEDPWF